MPKYMTEQQAADYIGCSLRWLQDRRFNDEVPYSILPPRLIRYDRDELDTWVATHSNAASLRKPADDSNDGVDQDTQEPT